MSKQPNFLFFITDQQRADWVGCYGHPVVRTPHIDAIASQGVRFDNFHVASPVCMPNRASLMTGRMPTLHGLRYNGANLPLNANTFVDVLAAGGYDTAAIGKSHLQPFTNAPAWRKTEPPNPKPLIKEAWQLDGSNYGNEMPAVYKKDGWYDFPKPYYGFNHVDMVTLHGDSCGGHYEQWFRENVPDWQALRDRANQLSHNYTCPQAYRTPIPEDVYPTAWIADRTIDFLSDRTESDAPFFAFVSFPDPHHPFNPPGKYWDMYSPDQFDVTLPFSAHKNPIPPLQWLEDNYRGEGSQVTAQTAMRLDDQPLKEAMALTAGMITCVDDAVGRVMSALKESGAYENTVVCFNSDHGDYLGDFNLLLKGLLPLRGLTRVPFIWSDPADRAGKTSQAMASTIDISTTILDRAGLAPYFGIQGRSMLDAINKDAAHRDELLIEFNDTGAKLGFEDRAHVRTIVTREWRYSIYGEQDWGELYDLKNDPYETHNLWDEPEHFATRARLAERMNHHLTRQMDESPHPDLMA